MRSLFFKIFTCFWLSHLVVVSLFFWIVTRVQTAQEEERRPNFSRVSYVSGSEVRAFTTQAVGVWDAAGGAANWANASAAVNKLLEDEVQPRTGLRAAFVAPDGRVVAGETPWDSTQLLQSAQSSGETEFFQGRRGFAAARSAASNRGGKYTLTLTRVWGAGRGPGGGIRGEGRPLAPLDGAIPVPGPPGPPNGPPPMAALGGSRRNGDGRNGDGRDGAGRDGAGRDGTAGDSTADGATRNADTPGATERDAARRRWQGGGQVSFLGVRMERRQADNLARFIAVFMAAGLVAFGLARYLTAPTVQLRRATQLLASGDLSARVGPQLGRRRDELADLGQDFDRMAERIEALMVSERRLLGDISHELGSPLARLRLAVELAQQGADEETQEYLTRIDREAGRLDTLIGQLLTLTRLETAAQGSATQASGDVGQVELQDLVQEVCADAAFEAQRQNRQVQIVAQEPCHVVGNADLLRSAIENVVRNAILHAPESSAIEIALAVDHAPVVPPGQEPEATEQGAAKHGGAKTPGIKTPGVKTGAAVITVRDHGPGVPQEALSQLFKPFYRVAEARDRRSGGVGLGLSITERAIRFHRGHVSAHNASGGGLCVEIRLPLAGR